MTSPPTMKLEGEVLAWCTNKYCLMGLLLQLKHAGGNDANQFVNETSILSQVNHRNLVKLFGYGVVLEEPFLVYEYISNGNLEEYLVKAQQGISMELTWKRRFNIAIQTADALKYLHVQASPPIFHRDAKSANILLEPRSQVLGFLKSWNLTRLMFLPW
ncbi:hypothetical protein L7F22_029159 [Adiantum nelumboides]|nr:hypothetical protein [Adiantum nelumboides]